MNLDNAILGKSSQVNQTILHPFFGNVQQLEFISNYLYFDIIIIIRFDITHFIIIWTKFIPSSQIHHYGWNANYQSNIL